MIFNFWVYGNTKFVTLSNQRCQVRPSLFKVITNEPLLYALIVNINKCGGSWSAINNIYTQMCVMNNVKMNLKVFNSMSRGNERIKYF